MPFPHGALSVYATEGLDEQAIWRIADEHVASRERHVTARGDVGTSAVEAEGLTLEMNGLPHPRHANIVGWPETKEKQLPIAKRLASAATLVVRGNQDTP